MTKKHSAAENDMSVQPPHTMEVAARKGRETEMQKARVAVKVDALWMAIAIAIAIAIAGQRKYQAGRFQEHRFDRVCNP